MMEKLKDIYYWFYRTVNGSCYYLKCLLFKRYNVLKVKTLSPTWIDRDNLLVHAMFQILTDFFEKEKPLGHFDIDHSPNKSEWMELHTIYKWWHDIGKNFDSVYDYDTIEHSQFEWKSIENGNFELITNYSQDEKDYWNQVHKREEDFEKQLTHNLKRLVELKGMLWT